MKGTTPVMDEPLQPTGPTPESTAALPDPTGSTAIWRKVKINGREHDITEQQAIRAVQQVGNVQQMYTEAQAGLGILNALQQNPTETLKDLAMRTGVDLRQLVLPASQRDDDDYEEDTPVTRGPDPSVVALQQQVSSLENQMAIKEAEVRLSRQVDEIKRLNPNVDLPSVIQFAHEQGFTDLKMAYKSWDYDNKLQELEQIKEVRPRSLPMTGSRNSSALMPTSTGSQAEKYRAKISTADAFKLAVEKLAQS